MLQNERLQNEKVKFQLKLKCQISGNIGSENSKKPRIIRSITYNCRSFQIQLQLEIKTYDFFSILSKKFGRNFNWVSKPIRKDQHQHFGYFYWIRQGEAAVIDFIFSRFHWQFTVKVSQAAVRYSFFQVVKEFFEVIIA